jgi:hypothetical protein
MATVPGLDAEAIVAERELIAAVDAGTVGFEPHGSDGVWSAARTTALAA